MSKEAQVFAVYSKDGELIRIVEAHSKAQVRAHVLNGITIEKASALTVSRSELEVEVAKGE